jgi:hypothetical protein
MLRITQLPTSSQFTFQSNQSNSIVCQFALSYGDILPPQSKDYDGLAACFFRYYRWPLQVFCSLKSQQLFAGFFLSKARKI